MPDKPLETTWVGTMLLPTLRRGRRFGRRLLRGARSRVLPRTGVLGDLPFSLPAASPLRPDAAAAEVRRLDVVVLTVPEESDQIPADYLEPLILAEQHSVPTVLVVAGAEEVKTPWPRWSPTWSPPIRSWWRWWMTSPALSAGPCWTLRRRRAPGPQSCGDSPGFTPRWPSGSSQRHGPHNSVSGGRDPSFGAGRG